jgi:hypothetical protein
MDKIGVDNIIKTMSITSIVITKTMDFEKEV